MRTTETVPGPGYVEQWQDGKLLTTHNVVEANAAGIQLINAAKEAERLAGEAAVRAAGQTAFQGEP